MSGTLAALRSVTLQRRESDMSRGTIALVPSLFLWPVLSLAAQAQSTITEQEAQAIGVDAYIYFSPLIT